jgi:hypothetical protein
VEEDPISEEMDMEPQVPPLDEMDLPLVEILFKTVIRPWDGQTRTRNLATEHYFY